MALTKRQREIYDFISSFVSGKGYSPSFEEIGSGMGLRSLATVHKHITNLERKGLLKRDYNRSRSIDLLPVKGIPRMRPINPRRSRARRGEHALAGRSGALRRQYRPLRLRGQSR